MIGKPQVRLLTALRDGYEGDEGQMAKITKDALTAAIATLESLPCTADCYYVTESDRLWCWQPHDGDLPIGKGRIISSLCRDGSSWCPAVWAKLAYAIRENAEAAKEVGDEGE